MLKLDIENLVRLYPPKVVHPNKRLLFDIAKSAVVTSNANSTKFSLGVGHELTVTKWNCIALPKQINLQHRRPELVNDTCAYFEKPSCDEQSDKSVEFYLNCSSAQLFQGYGSSEFSDQEILVSEHPVLASLYEYLIANAVDSISPTLVSDSKKTGLQQTFGDNTHNANITKLKPSQTSKSIIVCGAPHVLKIGKILSGSAFVKTESSTIVKHVEIIPESERTSHNIVSAAVPHASNAPTQQAYTATEIYDLLTTLVSAFAAAKRVGKDMTGQLRPNIVMHCGHWGCADDAGKTKGNKILIFLLMMLAANMVGLSQLIIHSLAFQEFQHALHAYEMFYSEGTLPVSVIVEAIARLGLLK